MTADAARQRQEYLTRLDAAMHDVPHGVATEIRAGIAEELGGLDATATAVRIEQLGDPVLIAREAGAEGADAAAPVEQPSREPVAQSRGFAIAAALVLAFGGFLIPVVGWFVGVVMVTISARWRRWEKIVAIAVPFVTGALMGLTTWISLLSSSADEGTLGQNPLVPSGLGLWHFGVLAAFLIVPISGGWLLWRLRRH